VLEVELDGTRTHADNAEPYAEESAAGYKPHVDAGVSLHVELLLQNGFGPQFVDLVLPESVHHEHRNQECALAEVLLGVHDLEVAHLVFQSQARHDLTGRNQESAGQRTEELPQGLHESLVVVHLGQTGQNREHADEQNNDGIVYEVL